MLAVAQHESPLRVGEGGVLYVGNSTLGLLRITPQDEVQWMSGYGGPEAPVPKVQIQGVL